MTVAVDVFDDERLLVVSSEPFRDKELLRTLPGSTYDSSLHRWFMPLTWAACQQLRGVFGDRLDVGPSLADWSIAEHENRIVPGLQLRQAWDAPGDPDLYPYQRAGVKFLSIAQRAILCDDMGTGKTVQIIRTLVELVRQGENPFPAIVVAPNNMIIKWGKEFEKWFPGLSIGIITGSAAKRRAIIAAPHHVYVVNWEGVRAHSRLAPYGSIRLRRCHVCDPQLPESRENAQSRCEWCDKELNQIPWVTVIADEAHRMKDPKAKQTRAVWSLRRAQTRYVYGATGTSVADAPSDMWPAMHLISRDEWPSRGDYVGRYCIASYNLFGTAEIVSLNPLTKDEFFKILDPRMRRMPKEAVLPFLPPKVYDTRYVEMHAKQATAYAQMKKGLLAIVDTSGGGQGVVMAANPLVQATRMTQFASSSATVDPVTGRTILADPSNKIDALMEIIEEIGTRSLVVFAQARQLIALAEKRLAAAKIPYGLIVGGQKPYERENMIERFQAGQLPIMLCTISAGGEGVTLTRASALVFLQRSWSAVQNAQAEDRIHRIGSEIHDSVTIIDLISSGTIEEGQRVVLGQKADRLQEIMRDKDTLAKLLSGEDIHEFYTQHHSVDLTVTPIDIDVLTPYEEDV